MRSNFINIQLLQIKGSNDDLKKKEYIYQIYIELILCSSLHT